MRRQLDGLFQRLIRNAPPSYVVITQNYQWLMPGQVLECSQEPTREIEILPGIAIENIACDYWYYLTGLVKVSHNTAQHLFYLLVGHAPAYHYR